MPRQQSSSMASTYLSTAVGLVDRVADYHTRQNVYNSVRNFCYTRPILASFLTVQLVFAALPLFFFLSFATFCIITAACFAAFWIGVGAMFLTSTLLILSFFAASLWVYLATCFYVIRYLAISTGYLSPSSSLTSTRPSSSTTSSSAAPLSISTSSSSTNKPPTSAVKAPAPPTPKKPSTEVKMVKTPSTSTTTTDSDATNDSYLHISSTGGDGNGNGSAGPDVNYINDKMMTSNDHLDFGFTHNDDIKKNEDEKTPMIPSFA